MSEVQFTRAEDWREPDKALAARFGMWAFLSTEMLFFGGIFCAYAVFRHLNPVGFGIGGHETDIFYGAINTLILATSAATMTVAANAADVGARRLLRVMIGVTMFLGLCFLAVKGLEYADDISKHMVPHHHFRLKEPSAEMFWAFYWLLTGLHAIHLTIGLGVLTRLMWLAGRDYDLEHLKRNVDTGSLYWHLVDVMWFVIYPAIYLAGRSG